MDASFDLTTLLSRNFVDVDDSTRRSVHLFSTASLIQNNSPSTHSSSERNPVHAATSPLSCAPGTYIWLRGGDCIDAAESFGLIRQMPSLRDISAVVALDITASGILELAPDLEYMRLRSEDINEVEDDAFTDTIALRDPFGNVQPNTPRGQRVFKSQEPEEGLR
ncbi:hypothetical protein Hypma_009947 [Hypsizygus marmoreus]|uniref:Uncharacterized protein n=1 Tax=Hypsizygus marmoreus TaxID=39966 RepID=A0A369JP09_HYPMA|nr:hypothetical protein Hypma_009947 [Hypsizygus marmoreus]